jgi:hypothetical protein
MTEQTPKLLLKPLTSENVENAYTLYLNVRAHIPQGYLGEKSPEDFERWLNNPGNSGGIGAFQENHLIAYTLYRRIPDYPYGEVPPFLSQAIKPGNLAEGVGSVINPQFQGKNIWHQLILLRNKILKAQGIDHLIGLIYQPNIRSITAFLKTGGLFIGLCHDPFGLNYVSYYGELMRTAHTTSDPVQLVCLDDIKGQIKRFGENRIVCGIDKNQDKDATTWCLQFSRWV